MDNKNVTSLSKASKNVSIDAAMHNIEMSSLIYDMKREHNNAFHEITYKLHQLTKKTEEDFKYINSNRANSQEILTNSNIKKTAELIDGLYSLIQDVLAEISDYYTNRNTAYIILPDYKNDNDILTVDELSSYLKNKKKNVRVVNNQYLNQLTDEIGKYKLDRKTENHKIHIR
jgi:hypothetical protein